MIASCSTPDIAMLRWIAYIKSLNPEFRHIAGKDNMVADMLSRARFEDEDQPNNEDNDKDYFTSYSISHMDTIAKTSHQLFIKEDYDHEFLMIGLYLSTMSKQPQWDQATFKRVRRKAYGYFLHEGHLWKHPKKSPGTPLRVLCMQNDRLQVMKECHESLWAGHCGIWATFAKIKERYW